MRQYIKTKPQNLIRVSRIVTIHYHEFGPSFVFSGEKHDFWELVYVDKGTVRIRRDEEEVTLTQGQILFHRPNEFHTIRSQNSSPNIFIISFTCRSEAMRFFERYQATLDKTLKSFLDSIIREAKGTYIIPTNSPELALLEHRPNAPLGGEQMIQMYLQQLLIFLLRTMDQPKSTPLFPKPEASLHPLVASIQTHLEANLHRQIRMEDLCAEFGYSRSYLNKLFQAELGMTPVVYATYRKIEKSKALLRETPLNIAQIAAGLGFESPQYFSRVFKRCTGMTPTESKNRAYV
jgi:AraC-like DNA-binding protein